MKSLILYFLLITLMFSCIGNPVMPVYQHSPTFGDSIIKKNNPAGLYKVAFNPCELFKSDWDSIIIVSPYSGYSKFSKNFDFVNIRDVKSNINNTEYRDDITTLLFIKYERIVSCERVYNVPVYFTSLLESTNKSFPVIRQNPCTKLYLRKVKGVNKEEYNVTLN